MAGYGENNGPGVRAALYCAWKAFKGCLMKVASICNYQLLQIEIVSFKLLDAFVVVCFFLYNMSSHGSKK